MGDKSPHDTLVTGIGLVTSMGGDIAAHRALLGLETPVPRLDTESFPPHPIHPLAEVDLSTQIPRRGDQRQMEPWQRYGTYAAGLALQDAGLAGDEDLLSRMDLIVAAGGGERDIAVDTAILEEAAMAKDLEALLSQKLMAELRPTLFLAQLSNLLAGNISIVHKVTGSSRTFMGEELAGAMALQVATRRIQAGQGALFLVGGAYNAARPDMLLYFALNRHLWSGAEVPPVWRRTTQPGGIVCGSMGAFLVLESRAHAEARGARAYARLDEVTAERGSRDGAGLHARLGPHRARLDEISRQEPAGLLSGASGAHPATAQERAFLEPLAREQRLYVRGCSTLLGHGLEAQMPACAALAALALAEGAYYPPFDADGLERPAGAPPGVIAVTAWGHWRGEALAVFSKAA